jgi:hypothetical protein
VLPKAEARGTQCEIERRIVTRALAEQLGDVVAPRRRGDLDDHLHAIAPATGDAHVWESPDSGLLIVSGLAVWSAHTSLSTIAVYVPKTGNVHILRALPPRGGSRAGLPGGTNTETHGASDRADAERSAAARPLHRFSLDDIHRRWQRLMAELGVVATVETASRVVTAYRALAGSTNGVAVDSATSARWWAGAGFYGRGRGAVRSAKGTRWSRRHAGRLETIGPPRVQATAAGIAVEDNEVRSGAVFTCRWLIGDGGEIRTMECTEYIPSMATARD